MQNLLCSITFHQLQVAFLHPENSHVLKYSQIILYSKMRHSSYGICAAIFANSRWTHVHHFEPMKVDSFQIQSLKCDADMIIIILDNSFLCLDFNQIVQNASLWKHFGSDNTSNKTFCLFHAKMTSAEV